ncbi:MAG: hypothetical protein A2X25_13780 [Chloroflexi bacterium GWB2_49_20]|nr:MAG: hypothetical protein A2X25_13780 [Chloroflexi bacterium GWB2_49_20]OGN79952.1 MAG: hypothetical protein A2X26_02970 [Chloroflexi bacterium GWC2_49_37]OGN85512.1 MAG: hypothetical protein A2X27_04090 [Chloroflexi bacterium GWD2_49_16]HBG74385.1 hypothetical protein [Anaerolineae bacterium]HCM97005.1 hypothetical protein [Anaerolineae bacterium]
MTEINKDLDYFQKGIYDLEEYLLSTELYWNLPGLSRLTMGGLLLAKVRLQESKLLPDQQLLFQELIRELETATIKWRVAWENKIFREIGSRLTLWQNYLIDYWSTPDEFADAYPREVRWRVMLQLLSDEVSGNFKERILLAALDERLRSSFLRGDFIWTENLATILPESKYWYLYGNLHAG